MCKDDDKLEMVDNMKKKPVAKVFPKAIDDIEKGKCPTCKEPITKFRDDLSLKEYKISGMCQKCQDKVFGV